MMSMLIFLYSCIGKLFIGSDCIGPIAIFILIILIVFS
jgi:hypothetical protein